MTPTQWRIYQCQKEVFREMQNYGNNQDPESNNKMTKNPTKEIISPLPPSPAESNVEVARRPIEEKVNPPSYVKPKVKLTRRPRKERVYPPLSSNKERDKDGDWDMIKDNFSNLEDDFDVLYNMVSMLPNEYDVVIEVTNVEEECFVDEMDYHKLVCYYVMNNNCIE